MHHTLIIIKVLIVWMHLNTLKCIQGNRFNTRNGSLIFIDGGSFHYHIGAEDSLLIVVRDSDVSNEYFKYCDEIRSAYSSDNESERGSGYASSGCICCTTTLCLCDSVQDAVHHTQNNTVIVMDSSVRLLVPMGPPLPYTQIVTTFENFTNLSLIGYNNATIDCDLFTYLH